MSESHLNKEFSKRDVQRMRNLITKKYGDKVSTSTGYTKEIHKEYKEGDVWEDNGKQWTIKNGIKQNITKLDKFKQLASVPILCPKCQTPMKLGLDKKMYFIHKMCSNCVIEFETKLKMEGKYEKYEKAIIEGNINHFLNEYEQFLNDISRNMNISYVSEDGVIEKWIGNNKDQIKEAKKQLANIKEANKSS